MNLGTAKNKVLMLMDVYSKNGTIQDPNGIKLKNYSYKMNPFFDTAQKQIATIKKIVKSKKISHNFPPNALPQPLYQNDIVLYTGTEQRYTVVGGKAYSFRVDDVATVYIKEKINGVWTTLYTITNPLENAGHYTRYSGFIEASSPTNEVGIFFNGSSMYGHRDRAIFTVSFSDASRIPNYTKYVPYTMPDDFYQFNKLVLTGNVANSQPYENTADFFWEQKNILRINWANIGEYSAEYFAYPSTIGSTTLDTYEFEIDIEAQEAMPLYVASQLLLNENNSIGDRLLAQYNNYLANLDTRIAVGPNSVSNSLFSGSNTKLF